MLWKYFYILLQSPLLTVQYHCYTMTTSEYSKLKKWRMTTFQQQTVIGTNITSVQQFGWRRDNTTWQQWNWWFLLSRSHKLSQVKACTSTRLGHRLTPRIREASRMMSKSLSDSRTWMTNWSNAGSRRNDCSSYILIVTRVLLIILIHLGSSRSLQT